MTEESLYGGFSESLEKVRDDLEKRIYAYSESEYEKTGIKLVDHVISRIKNEESMRRKCEMRGLDVTRRNALKEIHDAVGLRIVCSFIDDIYRNAELIAGLDGVSVLEEKDYVKNAKPNGYRSYHMIVEVLEPFTDIDGNTPGHYTAEIQIRTIAMDSWAALEHQMKYKKEIKNSAIIVSELKRCADEMASTDVSMQTIRDLISGTVKLP